MTPLIDAPNYYVTLCGKVFVKERTAVADLFNVSNHCIYRIAHGFNWSWLTGYGEREVAT